MSKRPFYTALGFVVWKAGKLAAKRKAKQTLTSPTALVAAVVVAGAIAGGATLASADSSSVSADA